MEHFICWTLMGLRSDGPLEVWYQLGTYPTKEQAEKASSDSRLLADQGIIRTRVMPYYRVDHTDDIRDDGHLAHKPLAAKCAERYSIEET